MNRVEGEPTLSPKRGKKLRMKLFVLCCSTTVALLIGEVALRIAAPPEDSGGLFLYDESAHLNSRGKPLAEGIYAGVPVRLNQLGLRDRDFAEEREPGIGRILVLGDSITFGQGVSREEAYPKLIEETLGREMAASYSSVEVLNFGIPGYNTCQQYAQFTELGLDFDPDLVIVGFLYNDILLSNRERASWLGLPEVVEKSEAPQAQSLSFNSVHRFIRKRSLLFKVCSSSLGSLARKMGASSLGQVGSYKLKYVDDNSDWLAVRKTLLALRDLGSERGFKVAVMVIPAMANMTESEYPLAEYHEAVSSFCQANDLPSLDLLPHFWGLNARRFHVSFLDGHPNAEAHGIIAGALSAFVLELSATDAGFELRGSATVKQD